MLKIRHSHNLMPHLAHSTHRLELSPAVSEHDELIEAIEAERDADTIELENTPDVRQLDEFWTGVTEDLEKDPDWFKFSDD